MRTGQRARKNGAAVFIDAATAVCLDHRRTAPGGVRAGEVLETGLYRGLIEKGATGGADGAVRRRCDWVPTRLFGLVGVVASEEVWLLAEVGGPVRLRRVGVWVTICVRG